MIFMQDDLKFHILRMFLPSFKSVGILVLGKKFKIDFQDGGSGGRL